MCQPRPLSVLGLSLAGAALTPLPLPTTHLWTQIILPGRSSALLSAALTLPQNMCGDWPSNELGAPMGAKHRNYSALFCFPSAILSGTVPSRLFAQRRNWTPATIKFLFEDCQSLVVLYLALPCQATTQVINGPPPRGRFHDFPDFGHGLSLVRLSYRSSACRRFTLLE